jgi:hypothetical protein
MRFGLGLLEHFREEERMGYWMDGWMECACMPHVALHYLFSVRMGFGHTLPPKTKVCWGLVDWIGTSRVESSRFGLIDQL